MGTDRTDETVASHWLDRVGVTGAERIRRHTSQGTTTSTFDVDIDGRSAVLKLFDLTALTSAIPDVAEREAQALLVAATSLGDVVPEFIAVGDDPIPGILMGRCGGAPAPTGCDHSQVVDVLLHLHATPPSAGPLPTLYGPWADLDRLEVPSWTADPAAWHRLLGLVADGPRPTPDVVLHRDVQPANLLWIAGELSAVIDWTFACRGPRSVDVAHYCMNVALCEGTEAAADVEVRYWKRVADAPDRYWDAIELVTAAQQPWAVAEGLVSSGVGLTVDDVTARCDRHAIRVAGASG